MSKTTYSEKPQLIFTASAARSGSTLLAFLLNAHSAITSIAEMHGLIDSVAPETYMCSCGARFADCPYWKRIFDHLRQQGFAFDHSYFNTRILWTDNHFLWRLQRGSSGFSVVDSIRDQLMGFIPGFQKEIRQIVLRNEAFALALSEVAGKHFVLDTSKDYKRIHYFNMYSEMALWVIHLVRDVRGVVASQLKRNPNLDIASFTKEWLIVNERIEQQVENLPENRHIRIRYEDLCNSPLEILNCICDFLKVKNFTTVPDFREVTHHIIGATMRLENSSEIHLDESWKRNLSATQIDLVTGLAAPYLDKYGYKS